MIFDEAFQSVSITQCIIPFTFNQKVRVSNELFHLVSRKDTLLIFSHINQFLGLLEFLLSRFVRFYEDCLSFVVIWSRSAEWVHLNHIISLKVTSVLQESNTLLI